MSEEQNLSTTNSCDSGDVAALARLFLHMRSPQNLMTYFVATAWMKFMGISQYIPTITIGG
jgi:hypothetical protein